jgi:hypothetical protein
MTDTAVYPPPKYSTNRDGTQPKKRKRLAEGEFEVDIVETTKPNDTQHTRLPDLMLANTHMSKIFPDIKSECEQLADLCVSTECLAGGIAAA